MLQVFSKMDNLAKVDVDSDLDKLFLAVSREERFGFFGFVTAYSPTVFVTCSL